MSPRLRTPHAVVTCAAALRRSAYSGLRALPIAIMAAACGGGGDGAGPTEPPRGRITVSTTTTGESPDADGYSVSVGGRSLDIAPNGTAVFGDLEPGTYSVGIEGVNANCTVTGQTVVPVTVSGGSSTATFSIECRYDIGGSTLPIVQCPALAPAATSGMPLAELSLGTVPDALQRPLIARVSTPDGALSTFTIVNDSAGARLIIPLHPSGNADGGNVLIRVSDDARSCEAFAFTIAPLPQAPGEFQAVVDLMQSAVATQASLAGTTVDALRTTDAASLPAVLRPMAVAQSIIDHPANPNSMRAIASGTAPIAAGIGAELLDRLMARTGFRAALEQSLAASSPRRAGSVAPTSGASGTASRLDAVACTTSPIASAAELDRCMSLASSAAFRMNGVSNKVLNDLGYVFGVAGLIPNPGTKLASAAAGLAMWAFQKVREGTANLLPSQFNQITVVASPAKYDEDEEGPGTWRAEVIALSKGWKLDQLALEALFQIAGGLGAHADWLKRFLPASLRDDIQAFIINNFVQQVINTTAGSGIVEAEPEVFGPVDVSAEPWSEAELVQGDAVELTAHNEHDPRKVGVAELQVRTRGGKFGGQQIESEPVPLEVLKIDLDFTYNGARVEKLIVDSALKAYTLKVEIENAKYPEQLALDPPTVGTATMTYDGPSAGTHTVIYTTPADLSELTALLTVRDIATTGAREYSTEPRVATLEIIEGAVIISPASVCMEPGAQQRFSAEVVGEPDTAVTWSSSLGYMASNGLYTVPAGATAGAIDTVRAVSVKNPELEGESIVQIGPCRCNFNVALSGGASGLSDGPAGFELTPTDALRLRLDGTYAATSGNDILVGAETASAWPGTPGTFAIGSAGFSQLDMNLTGSYRPGVQGFDCPSCGGSIVVQTVTADRITGSVSVTVPTGLPSEGLAPTWINATFSAARGSPFDGTSPYMACVATGWFPPGGSVGAAHSTELKQTPTSRPNRLRRDR